MLMKDFIKVLDPSFLWSTEFLFAKFADEHLFAKEVISLFKRAGIVGHGLHVVNIACQME